MHLSQAPLVLRELQTDPNSQAITAAHSKNGHRREEVLERLEKITHSFMQQLSGLLLPEEQVEGTSES